MELKNLKLRSEQEITKKWGEWGENDVVLSIWCITYNHVNFIKEAIEGFLAQDTDFSFRIIIHDDASNDGTQEILREYHKQYPHIIKLILQKENQYQKNKNMFCLLQNESKGSEFIALCEGDDFWDDKDKLQIQVDFLRNNKQYVASFHKNTTIDVDGNVVSYMPEYLCCDLSQDTLQKVEKGMPTRTIVMRNVIDFNDTLLLKYNTPNKILNGDTFLCSLLGTYGSAKFIDTIKPAFYRLHMGGGLELFRKEFARLHTDKKLLLFLAVLSQNRTRGSKCVFCKSKCYNICKSRRFHYHKQSPKMPSSLSTILQIA